MRYLLLCYDLSDDPLRDRVANFFLQHGERVQESVYELAFASESQEQRFLAELKKILNGPANVRAYRLSKQTLDQSISFDRHAIEPLRSVMIV